MEIVPVGTAHGEERCMDGLLAISDAWPLHRGFQKPQNGKVKKDQSAFMPTSFLRLLLWQNSAVPTPGLSRHFGYELLPLKLLTGTSPQL